MTITQHISIDLQQPGNAPMIHATQGDEYTRAVEIDLYSGGMAWNPPSGCEVVIRYGKPDGKGGIYGTLPDGTTAWSIDGNTVSVVLAPQMLTVPGIVKAQVLIVVDQKQLVSTFYFAVNVEEDASKGAVKSENYVNWKTYYIPQTAGAIAGQYLKISKVDADGRVIEVTPVDAPAAGGIEGDLDMKGCEIDNVGSLDFKPSGDGYSQAFWMQAGSDIKNADSSQTAVAEFYSSESDLPVVLRHIANGMQDDDAANVGQLKTRLIAPIKAAVGQYIRITAVDENGAVTAVEAVDAHPEATTTVADGSVTEQKLADGAVTLDKVSDYALATRVVEHVQSEGGWALFAFPVNGATNTTVEVSADVELLSADAIGMQFRNSESNSETDYGNLVYGAGASLSSEKTRATIKDSIAITDKKYAMVMVAVGNNKPCEYNISFDVRCNGERVKWSKISAKWGNATITPNVILETQERSALATVQTAKEIAAEAEANANTYTDESLAGYVYEIPDKSVPIAKIADSAFELDRYSILTLSSGDFAFLSLDISGIADRNGKTAEIEYYYTPLDENFTGLSNRMATGDSTSQYSNAAFNGSRTVIDEVNKIYKINATYTIASDTHKYLNLYPQIGASAETQVKFYGVSVTVDGKKLEWVEAHRLIGGTVFPIVGVCQEGNHLLKMEHAEKMIADSIGSVEGAVKDTKDEVAQLKALIGDGTNTVVESPLNGKKWGVVGDSITFGTGATDATTTYHGYISAKYLMTISNQGFPGKCIAIRPEYNDTLVDQLKSTPADCDFVTVFAGTNDFGNSIVIGTFSDTTNETFYGAVKNMCLAMYERFGAKKFAFLTPTQRSDGNNPNNAGKTLKDYRDVIIEVGAYYGIPVLDLYAESGINPGLCADFTGDGLHLNDAGHERISNRIAKFLESL